MDEVDLEWRCGQYAQPGTPAGNHSGVIIIISLFVVLFMIFMNVYNLGTLVLQDIDITSKSEQNTCVTRLNTLAHYGLKEKAVVSLVPKQLDSPSQHIYQEINSSTILYGVDLHNMQFCFAIKIHGFLLICLADFFLFINYF